MPESRLTLLRVVIVVTLLLAFNYLAWRWFASLNWSAWWIAVPLVLAETYSVLDVTLFGMTMWRARQRPVPPPPPDDATVDIFITTYNEPLDLVLTTARAAKRVAFPHTTWILDDGARPEMRAAAEAEGLGYITRGEEWLDRPRHAKAGNVNNALMATSGEFILILDADQIPRPEILHNTLGYFRDPEVALVQTPQEFSNVSPGDPLGSEAGLFYGPIQQGKDGWNAAFFCGSNALLRREALMQLGLVGYVREVDRSVNAALEDAQILVERAKRHRTTREPAVRDALDRVATALRRARSDLRRNQPIGEITYELHRSVDRAVESIIALDVASIEKDLVELRQLAGADGRSDDGRGLDFDPAAALAGLASAEDVSPLNAIEAVNASLRAIAIDRPGEAQPVMPLATISVTEDMATSMRLHELGWRSVYHHEVLADGLAPEDLGTMLTQRLRWAQGTVQVFLRENPLLKRAMKLPQRLMYFATMWSYFSGFASIAYLAAPIIYLTLGVLPVSTFAADFFIRFIPFFVVNQLLFVVASKGVPTWRGQQYSLALFPVWIRACTTAFNNVVLKIPLGFAVTPKTRQSTGPQWRLVRPQLITMALLAGAIAIGIVHVVFHDADAGATGFNIMWAIYDLVALSVIVSAVRYRGYRVEEEPGA